MNYNQQLFDEFAEELYLYIKRYRPEFLRNFEYILAQACYESGYFTSKLAVKYLNFFGMKYRGKIKDKVPTLKPCNYRDWEKENNAYCSVDFVKYSPYLYFAFIGRWPYKGYEDFAGNGKMLIRHLATCGYCASVEGVKRADYKTEEEYKNAVHNKYYSNIVKLHSSKTFNNLITNFIRKNINFSCLKELNMDDLRRRL